MRPTNTTPFIKYILFSTCMNDPFKQRKDEVLAKLYHPDKSKKGDVDDLMIPLIDKINNHPHYYTTSSCSGRIMLMSESKTKNKADATWHFVSHEQISFEQLESQINDLVEKNFEEMVWLKLEGMILHVCAKDVESAKEFLIYAQNNGYKHASLLAATKRFIIQIVAVERFELPLIEDGKLLVSKVYLKLISNLANKKLEATHADLSRLTSNFDIVFDR
jgi:tRNA wybutosine-synthesizing protein 3